MQCNTFEGEAGTSVTAVGALRGLLGVPGVEENVGMVGIHHRGRWGGPQRCLGCRLQHSLAGA